MTARRRALAAIFAGLFASSLILSLAALYQAAVEAEVSVPVLLPGVIDGFIVAMTLILVEGRSEGLEWMRWPRLGLYAATGFSGLVQLLYAPGVLGAQVLHTVPPVAVLFSFECLMRLLYTQRVSEPGSSPDGVVVSETPPAAVSQTVPGTPTHAPKQTPTRTDGPSENTINPVAGKPSRSDARKRLNAAYRTPPEGAGWTAGTLSKAARVGRSTAAAYLREQRDGTVSEPVSMGTVPYTPALSEIVSATVSNGRV